MQNWPKDISINQGDENTTLTETKNNLGSAVNEAKEDIIEEKDDTIEDLTRYTQDQHLQEQDPLEQDLDSLKQIVSFQFEQTEQVLNNIDLFEDYNFGLKDDEELTEEDELASNESSNNSAQQNNVLNSDEEIDNLEGDKENIRLKIKIEEGTKFTLNTSSKNSRVRSSSNLFSPSKKHHIEDAITNTVLKPLLETNISYENIIKDKRWDLEKANVFLDAINNRQTSIGNHLKEFSTKFNEEIKYAFHDFKVGCKRINENYKTYSKALYNADIACSAKEQEKEKMELSQNNQKQKLNQYEHDIQNIQKQIDKVSANNEKYKKSINIVKQDLAIKTETIQIQLELNAKQMQIYEKVFGMKIYSDKANQTTNFTFTHIIPNDLTKEFTFVIDTSHTSTYKMVSCKPYFAAADQLLWDLNCHRDFNAFIISMRCHFKSHALENGNY